MHDTSSYILYYFYLCTERPMTHIHVKSGAVSSISGIISFYGVLNGVYNGAHRRTNLLSFYCV
jgi:hypothetical protein